VVLMEANDVDIFQADQRRVICATDLSVVSERVVRASVQLSKRLRGQLTLLHVVGSGAGKTCRSIAAMVGETGAEIVVLGALQRRLASALLGTTPERVIELARIPVLVVRTDPEKPHDAVIFATDRPGTLGRLVAIAGGLGMTRNVQMRFHHVYRWSHQGSHYPEGYDLQAPEENAVGGRRTRSRRILSAMPSAYAPSVVEVLVQEGRPQLVLSDALRDFKRPLLVVGSRRHSILSRLINGSVANDALRHLPCDTLIIPEPS
jgi:universal stress protein E